ncbi:MAG: hypothetical protein IAI49_12200, partial [Candidatus Eremiobacteraeota bacterium]|nr:hypothetical protein [Candidatus Eremiobacteraeota bacterium]
RAAIAAALLREGGGRLVDVAAPPVGAIAAGAPPSLAPAFEATVPAEPTRVVTSSKIVSTTPLAGIDGAYEEVFVERRVVMPSSPAKPAGDEEPGALNDLL